MRKTDLSDQALTEAVSEMRRGLLAAVLNTSLSTVIKWEIDEKHPSGPSLKLLSILDRKGIEALA